MANKNDGLLWPTMLLVGSLTNIAGMTVAIARGDGDDSVAFKTGLFASIIYSASHSIKVAQVLYKRCSQPEPEIELEEVKIDNWANRVEKNSVRQLNA